MRQGVVKAQCKSPGHADALLSWLLAENDAKFGRLVALGLCDYAAGSAPDSWGSHLHSSFNRLASA